MQAIDFSSLPGFSTLFFDMVAGAPFLQERFPSNDGPARIRPEAIERRLSRRYDREALAAAVRATMAGMELNVRQRDNLDLLLRDDAGVVVTGQQAGLFGGPLYTLFKAQTAIRAASALTDEGVRCVPVFWVEDNDHDFAEIAQAAVFDRGFALRRFALEEPEEDGRKPVGARTWSGTDDLVEQLAEALQRTEFTDGLLDVLRRAYAPGQSVSGSFVRTVNMALAGEGLLFVSAWELQQRGMMAPVLRREIEQPGRSFAVLTSAAQQLAAQGYHLQAEPADVNCMLLAGGRRLRLEREGEDFRAGETVYTRQELLDAVAKQPHMLSPTVLTRPVVQDELLPTLAYVAGPGEIAYAAQLKELYELYDSTIPAFLLRHSATVLERRFEQFLADRGIAPGDMFRPYEQVEKEFTATLGDREPEAFREAEERLRDLYAGLETIVGAVDATLIPSAGRALTASLQQLEQLSGKVTKALKRQEETTLSKLRQAHTSLYPGHSLQERVVNWISVFNKFGPDGFRAVLRELTEQPPVRHYLPVPGSGGGTQGDGA